MFQTVIISHFKHCFRRFQHFFPSDKGHHLSRDNHVTVTAHNLKTGTWIKFPFLEFLSNWIISEILVLWVFTVLFHFIKSPLEHSSSTYLFSWVSCDYRNLVKTSIHLFTYDSSPLFPLLRKSTFNILRTYKIFLGCDKQNHQVNQ